MKTWNDLEEQGWSNCLKNNRVSYIRPNGTVVNRNGQLSEEESDIGQILFSGKRRKVETRQGKAASTYSNQPCVHDKVITLSYRSTLFFNCLLFIPRNHSA